jgi:hypothetical protein
VWHDCAVCNGSPSKEFSIIEGFRYFSCNDCGSIFIDPEVISAIDAGHGLIRYSDAYWSSELPSAFERSYGSALARVAEVFLYARRPILRFLDIGTGPGYLLDALSCLLPNSSEKFFGVELNPPPSHSAHQNYFTGQLRDLPMIFDAGSCIEVLEHLTPNMTRTLFATLATRSANEAIYIFNTGLPAYVVNEDPGYLDPLRRGHIVSYGLAGLEQMAKPLGFCVRRIPGKNWAFVLEFQTNRPADEDIRQRIWDPCPENVRTLKDPKMGHVLYYLGLETARAYT